MSYLHHIPGRIRVRFPNVKRNPAKAAALEASLRSLPGVDRVHVNPLTGGALIHYRPSVIDGERLIARLREHGSSIPSVSSGGHAKQESLLRPLERKVAKVVLQQVVEFAIERSVIALVAAVL